MNRQLRLKSKALSPNPKDLLGAAKISISKLPVIAVLHGAHAMMNGADKYGAYNWRDKKVMASIYVDALKRHADAWFEREELAEDSLVHHLGHAIACGAILLDAQATGNLIDDRPTALDQNFYSRELKKLNARVKELRVKLANGARQSSQSKSRAAAKARRGRAVKAVRRRNR